MTKHAEEDRIYIKDAAEILHRKMDTLRKWERSGVLPKRLRPHREETGRRWRYWTREQIEGIKDWLERTDRRPGKGLPTYDPSDQQVEQAIDAMRRPRK